MSKNTISNPFIHLKYSMSVFLIAVFMSLSPTTESSASLDFRLQVFKQCVYTAVYKCICCEQIDIIHKIYPEYGGRTTYISDKSSEDEIIFLVYKRGKKYELEGYPAYVIRKSKEDGKWREVLAGRSNGIMSWSTYAKHLDNKYYGVFCLQKDFSEGYRYAYKGDRYEIIEGFPKAPCLPDAQQKIKTYFDPK